MFNMKKITQDDVDKAYTDGFETGVLSADTRNRNAIENRRIEDKINQMITLIDGTILTNDTIIHGIGPHNGGIILLTFSLGDLRLFVSEFKKLVAKTI